MLPNAALSTAWDASPSPSQDGNPSMQPKFSRSRSRYIIKKYRNRVFIQIDLQIPKQRNCFAHNFHKATLAKGRLWRADAAKKLLELGREARRFASPPINCAQAGGLSRRWNIGASIFLPLIRAQIFRCGENQSSGASSFPSNEARPTFFGSAGLSRVGPAFQD